MDASPHHTPVILLHLSRHIDSSHPNMLSKTTVMMAAGMMASAAVSVHAATSCYVGLTCMPRYAGLKVQATDGEGCYALKAPVCRGEGCRVPECFGRDIWAFGAVPKGTTEEDLARQLKSDFITWEADTVSFW